MKATTTAEPRTRNFAKNAAEIFRTVAVPRRVDPARYPHNIKVRPKRKDARVVAMTVKTAQRATGMTHRTLSRFVLVAGSQIPARAQPQ